MTVRRYHSPSSTELGARCRRAWALCYIDHLRDPEVVWDESMATRLPLGVTSKQRSGALGTAGHSVLEAWYLGGTPAWHTYPGQVVEAGRHLLPTPGAAGRVHVEMPIGDEPIPEIGCQAVIATPDGEQRECGVTATYTAYPEGIRFCDEHLHDCMQDASPEEQATVKSYEAPTVGLRFGGVLWAGFRDLVVVNAGAELERLGLPTPDGVALFDYKTTSSIAKYAKDDDALRADLQCNLYALATMIETGLDSLPARWVYFETKAVRRALPTDKVISRADAAERVNAASTLAAELDMIERSQDAPQNVDACSDYGGCSYHVSAGGPCNARRSVGRLIQLGRKKHMPLTEEQKAKFATLGKKNATPPAEEKSPPTGDQPDLGEAADTGSSAPGPSVEAPKTKPKKGAAKAPAAGSLAEEIAAFNATIAQAEADLLDARGRLDGAVAALRARLA